MYSYISFVAASILTRSELITASAKIITNMKKYENIMKNNKTYHKMTFNNNK